MNVEATGPVTKAPAASSLDTDWVAYVLLAVVIGVGIRLLFKFLAFLTSKCTPEERDTPLRLNNTSGHLSSGGSGAYNYRQAVDRTKRRAASPTKRYHNPAVHDLGLGSHLDEEDGDTLAEALGGVGEAVVDHLSAAALRRQFQEATTHINMPVANFEANLQVEADDPPRHHFDTVVPDSTPSYDSGSSSDSGSCGDSGGCSDGGGGGGD